MSKPHAAVPLPYHHYIPPTATVEDALHEAYKSFYFAFRRHGIPITNLLLKIELPGLVFDLTVNAGWIAAPKANRQTTTSPLEYVQLGRFAVKRQYREHFLWLLRDALLQSEYDLSRIEKLRESLPYPTTAEDRRRYEKQYEQKTIDPKTGKRVSVKEICLRSAVDYRTLKRWRQGPGNGQYCILDGSPACERLLLLFLHDHRSSPGNKKRWVAEIGLKK